MSSHALYSKDGEKPHALVYKVLSC